MEEFNEAYPIKHDKLIEETFGMDEDEWKKFRVTALSEVSKEYRKEIKGWNERKKRAYYMLRLICEEEFITGMKGVAGYEDVTRKECPVEFARLLECRLTEMVHQSLTRERRQSLVVVSYSRIINATVIIMTLWKRVQQHIPDMLIVWLLLVDPLQLDEGSNREV